MREPLTKSNSAPPWQPLAFAVVLIVGVYIGMQMGDSGSPQFVNSSARGVLNGILDRVEQTYVDPVVRQELEEIAVEAILEELDPHSLFLSAEELAELAEPMEGNFEGIGVEFIIQSDTLMVVAAIPGGPAEKAGVRAGDRIITVDSIEISGPELDNRRVMDLLKGPKNTIVRVGVDRKGRIQEFPLKRDRIPIHSVVCAEQLDESRGYIKVVRFAQNTAEEFEAAMESLEEKGVREVIVDLRGNGGGYLNAVVPMVESFLTKGLMVVYTEGEHVPKRTYKSSRDGRWSDWDLAVLVDESSASASEIFAGAIQDHDRGPVIGRRTFGKGLVQEEFSIADLGALRLTVARFYTPTGRAIQKPYGEGVDYSDDYFNRYERGELFSRDSIDVADSLMYLTPEGKMVQASGGITPDVFVPLDTIRWSSFLSELSWSGVLRDAAFSFVDEFRTEAMQLKEEDDSARIWDWASNHSEDAGWIHLIDEAADSGIVPGELKEEEIAELKHRFAGQVIRNLAGESAYYHYLTRKDKEVAEGVKWLDQKERMAVVEGRLTLQGTE